MSELKNKLIGLKTSISYEQIAEGELDQLIIEGLQVIALCELGVRSGETAWSLNAHDIPAVKLDGGLIGLRERVDEPRFPRVTESIRNVPNQVVVLDREERHRHQSSIQNLTTNESWFESIHQAVHAFLNPDQ